MNAPTTDSHAAPADPDPGPPRLELLLGPPGDPDHPLGQAALAAADPGVPPPGWDGVLTPDERVALFAPRELGGDFGGVADLITRLRPVYRRDPATGRAFAGSALALAPLLWDPTAPRERREQAVRTLRTARPPRVDALPEPSGGAAGLLRAGMALAAVDTALRLTLDFALDRRLYQGTVTDLPHARATLADAFGRLLRADTLVLAASRARPEHPGGAPGAEAAALADAAQAAVSTALWPVVEDLGVVLGARSYLTEGRHASFARVYAELPALDPGRGTAFGRALLHRLHAPGDDLAEGPDDEAPLWVRDPPADRSVRACAELLARGCAAAAPDTAAAAGAVEERRDALFAELVDRFARARSFTAERAPLLW